MPEAHPREEARKHEKHEKEEAKGPRVVIPSLACVTVDLTWVEGLFPNVVEDDC